MASHTSSNALMAAVSAGGLYMLGQTAFRYGAHRLGVLFFGGTVIGLALSSLLLLHDFISVSSPSSATAQTRNGSEMQEISSISTCLICQRSASDISCKSDPPAEHGFVNHSFCKSCFNIYANHGLLEGGFFEQYETSPTGHISRPGELPCPMFSQGCRCSSFPSYLLRSNLTPENNKLLDDATERIALQRSLPIMKTDQGQGIRLRVFS